VVVRAKQGKDR